MTRTNSKKGLFQQYVKFAIPEFLDKYQYMSRLEESESAWVPKASSLDLGLAPRIQRRVLLSFKHNPKAWCAGEVSLNLMVCDDNGVLEEARFDAQTIREGLPGYYSLTEFLMGREKIWCLKEPIVDSELKEALLSLPDAERPTDEEIDELVGAAWKTSDRNTEYWYPADFSNQNEYFNETLQDMSSLFDDKFKNEFGL